MATSPAAYLNILLTANTTAANVALAKTQAQLTATGATATKTGATMKKAMLGIGVAAVGAGVALYKIGEEFDAASDKIRVGTGATGKELKRLEQNFKNVVSAVPASFEDASQAIADLNTRMGLTGKPLEKMTKQVTELSRITKTDVAGNVEATSKAFVDWEVKTKDMSKTLDGFFRVSQESGASVGEMMEAVQKFGSPLRQLGFDLEEAAAMWGTFVRAGVNTQTMVPGLKLALANLTAPVDELRTKMDDLGIAIGKPDEALREVFDLLGDGSTLSKMDKITLAMDVFGKRAGADMAEAIKQGRFEVDKMMEVFRSGEDTIRKAGQDTMDLSEHWQQFTNLLKVQLEPVATEVFEGLGDLMKEVTKTFKQDGAEGVLDLLIKKFEEALPKIAEVGAQIGLKLAGAIAKAFWNAPILGKLFMGAAAIRLFGGAGALTALGKTIGTRIGIGMGGPLTAALAALTVGAAGAVWGRGGLIDTFEGEGSVHWAEILELDELSAALRTTIHARDFAGLTQISDLLTGMQENAEAAGQALPAEFYAMTKAADRARDRMSMSLRDISKGMGGVTEDAADMARQIGRSMRSEENAVERASGKTDRALDIITDALGKGGDASGLFADRSGKSFDRTDTAGDRMSKGVQGAVNNLVAGMTKGYGRIEKMTSNVLTTLGVGKVSFNIAAGANAVAGKQHGGVVELAKGAIVPGTGSGDKVPLHIDGRLAAMVESGELVSVANRNATAALMGVNARVPRFAQGGLAFALGPYDSPPIDYDAGHAGGNSHVHVTGTTTPWVVALGKRLQSMGFMVGEHPAFGGVAPPPTHSLTGGHYDALAIDINSAADETRAEVASIARLLGGAGGAIAKEIERVMLEGPAGALRSIGQGGLDMVHKAANAYLAKHAPTEGMESGASISADGDVERVFAQVARQLSNSKTATLALGMAGYAESGMQDLSYGDSSSQGALQLLASTAAGLGVSPHDEGAIASLFLNRGFYGRGGANTLAASGLPAHLVAQSVQGSAFSDGSNYAAQSGPAKAWMQRFGLERGGIVEGLKGGSKKPIRLPGLGKSNKSPFGPTWTGGITGGVSGGRIFGLAELAKAQQLKQALDAASIGSAILDERIDIADTLAGLASSEFGSELGPNERSALVALHEQLLSTVQGSGYIASIGRSVVGKGLTLASGTTRDSLADLAETFGSAVTDAFGLTGRGGRAFELGLKITDLKTGTSTDPTNPVADILNMAGLRDIIQAAQFGVFAGQLPKFHGGGVVPGPVGAERPIMALGGERYLGAGQPQTLHADIAINLDGQIIRRSIEVELTERDRASRQAQRAGV